MALLPVSQNNTFNQWLSVTNQSSNVLNQLTDGILNVNGTIIFTNSNFNLTLAGNVIANTLVLTAPSGNTMFLQSSNSAVNGVVYIIGPGNSLHVNGNGIFNALNVNGTTNTNNIGISGTLTFNKNINVSANIFTANMVSPNVIANNIVINNTNISNGNITLIVGNALTLTIVGNTNSTTTLFTGNAFANNVIVNRTINTSKNTTITKSLTSLSGAIINNITLNGTINTASIQGTPTLINCSVPVPLQNDNSLNVATTSYVAPAFNNTGRNFILNPNFEINQRGNTIYNGVSNTATYTFDRWILYQGNTQDNANVTIVPMGNTDLLQIGDETANNYASLQFVGGSTNLNLITFSQNVENMFQFSGQTYTVSFWANSPTNLNLAVGWQNIYGSGSSNVPPRTFGSVTLSSTWKRYSLTTSFPISDNLTIGSSVTPNTTYNSIIFVSSAGPGNTLGSNVANNIGAQSGTINLWGIQLEPGSIISPYKTRDPEQELALCQRYYMPLFFGHEEAIASGSIIGHSFQFPVTMRIIPSVTMIPTSVINAVLYPSGTPIGFTGLNNYGGEFIIQSTLNNARNWWFGFGLFSAEN